jgi:hypothetical protein
VVNSSVACCEGFDEVRNSLRNPRAVVTGLSAMKLGGLKTGFMRDFYNSLLQFVLKYSYGEHSARESANDISGRRRSDLAWGTGHEVKP